MYSGSRKLLFPHVRIVPGKGDFVSCTCILCPKAPCGNSPDDDYHYLSPPPPPPPAPIRTQHNMPVFFILMLCTLGAAFVFFCCLAVLRKYRSNSRRRFETFADAPDNFVDENRGPGLDHPIWYIRTVGLPQSVIDSIAVFNYKKGETLVEGTDCSVCLSEFEEDESLRLLPKCTHAFHINCIDTWLRSHQNCPLCRAPIISDSSNTAAWDSAQTNTDQSVLNLESGEDPTQINGEDGGGNMVRILERNNGIGVLSDLEDHRFRVGEEQELQSVNVRRSFSMDLSSASQIHAEVANNRPVQEEGCSFLQEVEELKKKQNLEMVGAKKSKYKNSRNSFSFGRSLQSVPIRMKRSSSSSGCSSFHKNSRSQEE